MVALEEVHNRKIFVVVVFCFCFCSCCCCCSFYFFLFLLIEHSSYEDLFEVLMQRTARAPEGTTAACAHFQIPRCINRSSLEGAQRPSASQCVVRTKATDQGDQRDRPRQTKETDQCQDQARNISVSLQRNTQYVLQYETQIVYLPESNAMLYALQLCVLSVPPVD